MARDASAFHQTMIPTMVLIKERSAHLPEAALAEVVPISPPVAPTVEQGRRKRVCSDKEQDFLGTNSDEPVKEVLEALPPENAVVALTHHKYWIEAWKEHTTFCTAKDLVATNNACVAPALSIGIQLGGLIKDLREKNIDLAQRLEKAALYGKEVRATRNKSKRQRSAGSRSRAGR